MSPVACPLPEPLDYAKAKATYAQVRKDTNYKLSPEANRREAARRLGTDYDTFSSVLATKGKALPPPSTLATKPKTAPLDDAPERKAYEDGWLASRNAKNPDIDAAEIRWYKKNRHLDVSYLDDWNRGWTDQASGYKKWTSFKPRPKPTDVPEYMQVIPRMASPATHIDALKSVNPKFNRYGYTEEDLLASVNCQKTVVAYEMRRRGYDVVAKTGNGGYNWHQSRTHWLVKREGQMVNPKPINALGDQDLVKKMITEPVGARFFVNVAWPPPGSGGGHVFSAEHVSEGVIRFFDPQTGDVDAYEHLRRAHTGGGYTIFAWRVDNATPKADPIKFLEFDKEKA